MTTRPTCLIAMTIALVLLAPLLASTPATARPPTVQFSPGYEMRLAEERARLRRAEAQRLKAARPAKQHRKR